MPVEQMNKKVCYWGGQVCLSQVTACLADLYHTLCWARKLQTLAVSLTADKIFPQLIALWIMGFEFVRSIFIHEFVRNIAKM